MAEGASRSFVHLHVHSEFSLLDGASRISAPADSPAVTILDVVESLGMPAIGMTDHGVMFGALDFYRACRGREITPILGVEAYVAPGSRFDRTPGENEERYRHLTILARNETGYRNLLRLVTDSHLEGFYPRPRGDKDLLAERAEGLIGFTGCLAGEVCRLLMAGQRAKALEVAAAYRDLFGEGSFYVEVQDHGLAEQGQVTPMLIELAGKLGLPLVATNDTHYTEKAHARAHDVLLCIQQPGKVLADTDRLRFDTEEFYLKSAEPIPMLERPLVERAEPLHVPRFDPPGGGDHETFLRELAEAGARERYGEVHPEVRDRLGHELRVISSMGFAGYFLIVWDLIRFARERGIRVGPGRGSAAGSVVSYCLRITDLDPLRYGLIFERFLNPERKLMPDIDMDFDERRRDEIIRYVAERYGHDHVAQIITFQTIKGKQGIRDAARVLGFPAGVVIGDRPLVHYLPLKLSKDSRDDSRRIVTQFDMHGVEDLGLLKMDFLGLRTLSVIEDAVRMLRERGIHLDIDHLPLDDEAAYAMLRSGETTGVFQLEGAGMRSLIRQLAPDRFEDLMALVALYRPGPLSANMHVEYAERKHDRRPVTYPHADLEPILAPTYGVIVYQEQVMEIAVRMAGYTMGQADLLRKAMGKKIREELVPHRETFVQGAVSNGYPERLAQDVFDLIVPFADYGFNASHACGYALIAYQTAYLKANHPVEYMAALLTSVKDDKDRKPYYLYACRSMGIEVLPPDVNDSAHDFAPATGGGRAIRYGLSAVRNVGEGAVQQIIRARAAQGTFESFSDFCRKVDPSVLSKRVLESLILAGAFDSLGYRRRALLIGQDKVSGPIVADRKAEAAGQFSLFGGDAQVGRIDESVLEGEEFDKPELLRYEKDMLGQFVTDHPLLEVADPLRAQTTHEIGELEAAGDGELVTVGGIIGAVMRKYTKRGEPYAQFRLEGLAAGADVVALPSVYEADPDLIAADRIVLVTGRIDRRGRELQVRA